MGIVFFGICVGVAKKTFVLVWMGMDNVCVLLLSSVIPSSHAYYVCTFWLHYVNYLISF